MDDLVREQITFNAEMFMTKRTFVSTAAYLLSLLVELVLFGGNFGEGTLAAEALFAPFGVNPGDIDPVHQGEEVVI